MSYSAQYRQFLISYRAFYGYEPSDDEITAFERRHGLTREEHTQGTRYTACSSFQTAGPP